jgi:N-acetylmuramoyl-L-alanine amidase
MASSEDELQPYVIKQGDYLALLAHKFGFDDDAVWNDPKNTELRQLRPNPNILWPTDILYIPDQVNKKPETFELQVGTTNTFTAPLPPTTKVSVKFAAADPAKFASQAYTIQEIPSSAGLTTDGDGVASFEAPVDLRTLTLVFAQSGQSFRFSLGTMDPIDTITGIFARLQNLGYVKRSRGANIDLDVVRAGLWSFQQSLGQTSSPSSGGSDAAAPSDESGPASGTAAAPGNGDPPWRANKSIMAADGTIEPDLAKLLVHAHGS